MTRFYNEYAFDLKNLHTSSEFCYNRKTKFKNGVVNIVFTILVVALILLPLLILQFARRQRDKADHRIILEQIPQAIRTLELEQTIPFAANIHRHVITLVKSRILLSHFGDLLLQLKNAGDIDYYEVRVSNNNGIEYIRRAWFVTSEGMGKRPPVAIIQPSTPVKRDSRQIGEGRAT